MFLIPFFSWLLVSFGGIAVQRHKREQAIQALGAAVASAGQGTCDDGDDGGGGKNDDHDDERL